MDDLKFIQVGELARGISENVLPAVETLGGRSLKLFIQDGGSTRLTFADAHDLRWEVLDGHARGASGEEVYSATCFRDSVYLSTTSAAHSGLRRSALSSISRKAARRPSSARCPLSRRSRRAPIYSRTRGRT